MVVEVGRQINATNGKWQHEQPSSYSYQWERSTDAYGASFETIAGQTSPTYTVQAADKNHLLRCKVKPTNSFGSSVSEYTPYFIVATERSLGSALHYAFAYGPGGVTGRACVLGVWPNLAAGSRIALFLHEGAFFEQTVKNEPAAGTDVLAQPEPPTNAEPNFNLRARAENFVAKGWTVVCVNWRQDSNSIKPGFIFEQLDILRAVQWCKANAEAINGDPGRVYLVGGSGGASLALMCAALFNQDKPGYIKGCFLLSGISSVADRAIASLEAIENSIAHPFGTLTSAVEKSVAVEELKVTALTKAIGSGETFWVTDGTNRLVYKATAEAAAGATVIKVEKQSSTVAWAIGAKICEDQSEEASHVNHMEQISGHEELETTNDPRKASAYQVRLHMDTVISAIGHLSANICPILLFISEKDKVPTSQGTILKEKLEALGLGSKLTFTIVAGGAHAFAMWGTTLPSGKAVSEEGDAYLKAIA